MKGKEAKNKLTKAGYLVIVVAIMVAFSRVFVVDSNPSQVGGHFEISPNSENFEATIWDTRNVRVVIDLSPATSRISVYLFDEAGIKLLHDEGVFEPVFSLEDVDGCDFAFQPRYRGIYAFLIQNTSNQTARISQRVIHQGLEWDILQFSGILAIIGFAMALLPRLPYLKKAKI